MAEKYHSDTQEKLETIHYTPDCQTTGDLEAGAGTVTAAAEASGTGNADYSKSLTLAAPEDARLTVQRIAARLAVTMDSMTAGHLYCRVYVDQQDVDHRLFDEDWTGTGNKIDAVDTYSGALSVIFDDLSDGASHTFYFFFWVDSGNAVISEVELWEGIGTWSTGGTGVLNIAHRGLIHIECSASRYGSGSISALRLTFTGHNHSYLAVSGGSANSVAGLALVENPDIYLRTTVTTDIIVITQMHMTLRNAM